MKLTLTSPILIILLLASIACDIVSADEGLTILRPSFDIMIEKVPGENYVFIDKSPYSYLVNRPINQTYYGVRTPELEKIITSRVNALEELKEVFLSYLPELEKSVGLKFWAFMPCIDEDPPALYIGLYRPIVEQMKTIVKLLGDAAKSKGIIIKFYEALAHREMESKLNESWYKLIGKYNITNPPIVITSGRNEMGVLEVNIVYDGLNLNRKLIVETVKSIREIIGYEVPLVLSLTKEPAYVIELVTPDIVNKSSITNTYIVTSMKSTNTSNITETNTFNEFNTLIAIMTLILVMGYLTLRVMENRLLRRKSEG